MKRSFLYLIAGAAVFAASSSFAADMAVKAAPPAPPPSNLFNWTGFQGGIDLGYSNTKNDSDIALAGLTVTGKPAGFMYGGHILAQHQFANNWVAGVGLTLLGSSADDDTSPAKGVNVKERTKGLAFAEGRLGYALNNVPYLNNLLPYVSFGVASARSDATISAGGGSITSQKFDNYGWTIGGGLDTAITPNVIWNMVNVRYYDLGSQDASFRIAPGLGLAVPVDQKGWYVGTGLSWKFSQNAPLGF